MPASENLHNRRLMQCNKNMGVAPFRALAKLV
jgi:hypothetical protein